MARPIVLSNGELHVGLNNFATVHDFYFPYVGLENHAAGGNLRHKVGIWVEGQISWTDNPQNPTDEWIFSFHYPHDALIGHTIAKNNRLGVILEFEDFVDSNMNVFVRNIHIVNLRPQKREFRLFMHQAFAIGDSRSNTDTAQYLPSNDAILHYRGRRAFIVSGKFHDDPFDQYTVGLFGIENHEGTYKDAEDGELSFNNVEHGRVDSTIRFRCEIDGNSSDRVYYWIAAGKSIREAISIHKKIQNEGALTSMQNTAKWWHDWLKPAYSVINKIDKKYREIFMQSLMIIKSQIDKRGAVIASTDTSMLNYSRDAYAYSWPRDGAYALWPLLRLGYTEELYNWFEFCKKGLHSDGYLMHKYRADGALGSSWHSYIHDGLVAPPIQEDETALPLYIFVEFYKIHPSETLIKEYYQSMVKPMANFLSEYINKITGLPMPSYDLWEQTFLTSTYTVAVTYAALLAVADMANEIKDKDNAVKWRAAAEDIKAAALKYLYNKDKKTFYMGLNTRGYEIVYNATLDCSSVFGVYMFGLFDDNSEEIKNSIDTILKTFNINDNNLKLPRYENDYYRKSHSEITGNYWFITSLWLAQYFINERQIDKAEKILDWAKSSAFDTGVLGEQQDPITGEMISPAPLTWTHAEIVSTILDMADKK